MSCHIRKLGQHKITSWVVGLGIRKNIWSQNVSRSEITDVCEFEKILKRMHLERPKLKIADVSS